MKAESININWDILNPSWLLGPIFDKELRVSSRRKKNYRLRFSYIILLCLLLFIVWLVYSVSAPKNSALYLASRSAEMGRQITIVIVWFQFIASQILAAIMLSSSISDEIRSGTLNVLMTTPINSFQIVIGKFFSKLLQIFLLLAVSLPLLAIIRVFGGISWEYLLFSIIITFTSVILAGSLSLLLSVFIRQAYQVIVLEILCFLLLYAVTPILSSFLFFNQSDLILKKILVVLNPFYALFLASINSSPSSLLSFYLFIHFVTILALSCVFLGISILKIRSVSLSQSIKKHKNTESKRVIIDEQGKAVAQYYEYKGKIKRVTNSPIIWKEMYKGYLGEGLISKIIYIVIALALIATSMSTFRYNSVSATIAGLHTSSFGRFIIYFIMILRLAANSASSIAREKEGRTLSILLVSPINDKNIIIDKVKGAILKNMPLFILYLIPTFLISLSRNSSNSIERIFHVLLSVFSIAANMFFVSCCGVYHGARSKNSTSAIAATITSYFVIVFIGFNIFSTVVVSVLRMLDNSSPYPNILTWYTLLISIFNILALCGLGLMYLSLAGRKIRKSIF